jgi:signal transduction histidine kinase
LSGFGTPGLYWLTCRIWFLLNAVSFLVFGPAMFGWLSPRPTWKHKRRHWWLEAALLLTALVLLGCATFFTQLEATPSALLYSLIPLLLWAALRFGSDGVSNCMIFVAIFSVWGAVHGQGPFAGSEPQASSLRLLFFLLFAATPFILLAAVAEDRERAMLIQRALSGRLISAQEQERRRIARELHDDISQKLAILSLEVEHAKRDPDGSSVSLKEALDKVQKSCSELMRELHSLSHELHSSNLEYMSIASALEYFCKEFSQTYGVVVQFRQENVPRKLPQDVALSLFRIAQEALNNARKYSETETFSVELAGKANEIRLTVRDWGAGFDIEEVRRTGGLGLVSMEERAHLVEGNISIQSRPGAGTMIVVTAPLNAGRAPSSERESIQRPTTV